MDIEQVSETGGVNGWDKDLVIDGFVNMFVVGDFAAPRGPLILLDVPVVVIDEASFGVLDFREGSEDA